MKDMAFGLAPHHDLTSRRMRRRIAAGIESVIEDAHDPEQGMSSKAPMQRHVVLDAEPVLRHLADRLGAEEPVRPRGVVMSLALLTDASGPLYHAVDPHALTDAVLEAADALEDGTRF